VRTEPHSTRRALIFLGVILLILLLMVGGAALWLQHVFGGNIERIPDPFAGVTERPTVAAEAQGAMNVLVLGSDSRISAGDPNQWAAGSQRTDAIMLVHIAGDRKSAVVVSIPRDSWVPIPGHGDAKINAAYSWGGPTLTIQTVEQLTGVHIDHFAVADFESFTKLTDALGGVEIRIADDVSDGQGLVLTAGVHHMNGQEALAYARQRHGLPGGDFDRVQRQQNWMRAIMAKANNSRSNIPAMWKLINAVGDAVAVDSGFTTSKMRDLLMSSTDLHTNNVTFLTAPYQGTGRSPDGKQSIVVLDRAKLDPLMAAIASDQATAYIAANKGALKVLPVTPR
jgi:LCP family protein required for cell wall assembly